MFKESPINYIVFHNPVTLKSHAIWPTLLFLSGSLVVISRMLNRTAVYNDKTECYITKTHVDAVDGDLNKYDNNINNIYRFTDNDKKDNDNEDNDNEDNDNEDNDKENNDKEDNDKEDNDHVVISKINNTLS
jgi:hypothetical protein